MNIWKDRKGSEDVALADQLSGTFADKLGYERKSKEFHLKLYLKSRPMALYCCLLRGESDSYSLR